MRIMWDNPVHFLSPKQKEGSNGVTKHQRRVNSYSKKKISYINNHTLLSD